MMKIRSVLIANRGEIACRIIRTCKKLGIRTVTVFSEPDRTALHVTLSDEAISIGGFESKDSYLKISSIVAAAKAAKVDAVHPGYGFLSENPLFADALDKAGIKLIGPSAKTMRALGDKIRAKELARRCNVPTVPSIIVRAKEVTAAATVKEVAAFGAKYGYPLLIKASAGGGGRGMRRATSAGEIKTTLASASREAEAFFGDGRVFVEKLLLNPRHIEVQILGDSHGSVTHLYDRDCTMQRRHQKVVEEAPAPHLPPRVRAEMLACATRLAEAATYENAGTAEFLLDRSGTFYFLEVNSRLQVEHPVTEEHLGLDLVELQIRVAEGEILRDLLKSAHPEERRNVSIEVRVCAEDPDHDFAPSTGRIEDFVVPAEDGIRVETGVITGSFVRHYYDPLIAKIIATGADREDARIKLISALEASAIIGVKTNIPYLTRLLRSTPFISCSHDTKIAESFARSSMDEDKLLLKVAALWAASRAFREPGSDSWNELKGFRIAGCCIRNELVTLRGREFKLTIAQLSGRSIRCGISNGSVNATFEVTLRSTTSQRQAFLVDKEEIAIYTCSRGARDWIVLKGESFEVLPQPPRGRGLSTRKASGELHSPLPGKILEIRTRKGSAVKAGDIIFVLESMKMEHSITAPQPGILTEIFTTAGKVVDAGAVLGRIGDRSRSNKKKRVTKKR